MAHGCTLRMCGLDPLRISMRLFALCLVLAVPSFLPAQANVPVAAVAAGPLNQNFGGSWAGQLEYKDYGNGERVFLPTWVETVAAPAGNAVTFNYTYDDGPTKVVRESVTLTFDGATATITSGKEKPAIYSVAGLEVFRKVNRGTLVLTGTGTDNDKPADVRITITLRRNLYTWVKETRAAGTQAPFVFRDGYTFTRLATPKG